MAYGKTTGDGPGDARARGIVAASGLVAILAALGAGGCAKSASTRANEGIEAVRRDATPAKLEAAGSEAAVFGDMTRAEQYYTAAIKVGGDERRLTEKLLHVCVADERYPAALDYGDRYLAKHPADDEMRFAVASILAALADTDRARRELERVLSDKPELADAHFALAVLLRDGGGAADVAREHFGRYLTLDPKGRYAETARAEMLRASP